jgi:TonB family protein
MLCILLLTFQLSSSSCQTRPKEAESTRTPEGAPHRAGKAAEQDYIRAQIKECDEDLAGCYQLGLLAELALNGRVVVDFVIDEKGAVSQAEIASTSLNNETVESCVIGVLRTIAFEKLLGQKRWVRYPFAFKQS